MPEELDPSHYRAILESLPNGVYVVDPERRILFWNDGAEQITGYLRHEIIGRLCHDNLLMHCDENSNVLCGCGCPLLATMHDGRPRDANVFLRHKDGQRMPVRVRAVPLRDAGGSVIGAAESFDEHYAAPDLRGHAHTRTVHNHLDELTGISDRPSTRSYLQAYLEDFVEDHTGFSVLSIAVDEFEKFRAAHSVEAAQRILHAVAVTLRRNLREGDVVGHWDEGRFVIILADCPAAMVGRVAKMLMRVVSGAAISWWGDRLSVTVSIGGTAVRAGDTVESVLLRAEQALRSCLEGGGSGMEFV
jgi:diguanylate cyclase (GGDEF)-like protein/PAS domain S-box-containing protein